MIVIDHLEYRLEIARTFAHAETVNFTEVDDIVVHLKKLSEHAGAQPGIVARRCVDRRSRVASSQLSKNCSFPYTCGPSSQDGLYT